MWTTRLPIISWSLFVQLVGCTNEFAQRDNATHAMAPPAAAQYPEQSETAWLRAEVYNMRMMLAERDRRQYEMWQAYTALVQRVSQLQSTQQPEGKVSSEVFGPDVNCAPSATSSLTPPAKSVTYAVNRSRLNGQQKRELLRSLQPPRVIDNINPWAELKE